MLTIRKYYRSKSWITCHLKGQRTPVHVSRSTFENWLTHNDKAEDIREFWNMPSEVIFDCLAIYIQYNELSGSFQKVANDPVVRAKYEPQSRLHPVFENILNNFNKAV